MVIDKDLILLDLTGDKETMIYNCYEYELIAQYYYCLSIKHYIQTKHLDY